MIQVVCALTHEAVALLREVGAANATEGTCPERPRAPGRSTPAIGPRSLDCSFLIERAHDPSAQLRWSTAKCQVSTDRGARLFEILKQGAALGAVLSMPFNIGSRDRIDLAVEVSLHAQRFSAPHAALPRPLSAIVPSGQPVRAPAETSLSQSGCS